jgi:hypothetical protein
MERGRELRPMVGRSLVTRDQFEISEKGITHKPTGWNFTPYPGNPTDGTIRKGQLGNKLPAGEDYRPHEVEEMARRLWLEHLAKKRSE